MSVIVRKTGELCVNFVNLEALKTTFNLFYYEIKSQGMKWVFKYQVLQMCGLRWKGYEKYLVYY